MFVDLYPSRQADSPSVFGRRDPIIYSDWFPDAPLDQEQAISYVRDGFLVLTGLFQPPEIKRLQEEAISARVSPANLESETLILEPEDESVRSIFKIHKQCEVFSQLASDARLVNIARFLLGDEVYLHQSRLNYKPGFTGKDFYWHSDFETWHVEDGMPHMRALSMSILLTDNTEINGSTMFMPGSHKAFVSCVGETPSDHYKKSLRKQEYGVPTPSVLSDLSTGGIEMPTGPAGSVIIFDSNLMHGSNSNITPFPRSNAFLVYNARSNKLLAPFGPEKPRPEFIASRDSDAILTPREGALTAAAA